MPKLNLKVPQPSREIQPYHESPGQFVKNGILKECFRFIKGKLDEITLLGCLGNGAGVRHFVTKVLEVTKLSCSQILDVVNRLKQNHDFTNDDILRIQPSDVLTIWKLIEFGKVSSTDAWYVYENLPEFLYKPLNSWLTTVAREVIEVKGCCVVSAHLPSDESYDSIIRYYVRLSVNDFSRTICVIIKLFRFAVKQLTDFSLPKETTIYSCFIWFMMITDIQKIPCHEKGIDKGVLVFAVFVEYLAFLARENIVSLGDDCSEMLDEISLIQGNTDSCMVNGTVKKYLCWNNILSVLIDQEGLSEREALTMLSTFTLGLSVKELWLSKLKLSELIKRLVPIPTETSVCELVDFFRDQSEYFRRRVDVFMRMGKKLEGLTEISDRIVISCQTYRQLLRLKAAFISFDTINGMNAEIDMQLIDEIVKKHCLCGYMCKWYARIKYKRKLKETLEKSQDFAYADFYGIPKNPLFRFFDDKIY